MTEVKIFNKWPTEDIEVKDEGLKRYISLHPVVVPRSGARYADSRFHKSEVHLVERLINKVMVPGHRADKHTVTSGHNTGKAGKAYRIVENALEYVEEKLGKNPVEVLVRAVENGAPREEIITIEYGGARYPKAIESAPQRRVDLSVKLLVHGAHDKSFNSKKSASDALAEEIISAYNKDKSARVISKKLQTERQADSSR